jgi:hypothetical protein
MDLAAVMDLVLKEMKQDRIRAPVAPLRRCGP